MREMAISVITRGEPVNVREAIAAPEENPVDWVIRVVLKEGNKNTSTMTREGGEISMARQ